MEQNYKGVKRKKNKMEDGKKRVRKEGRVEGWKIGRKENIREGGLNVTTRQGKKKDHKWKKRE